MRHVGDGTRTAAGETATNGCGVRGTLRLVAGWDDAAAGRAAWAPPRDWFGLSTDPGQGSTSAPSKNTPEVFSVRLGDGRCAEGFEACLKGIKKGTVARCHVAGECLLPDEVSGAHVDAVVPEGWWRDAEARYRDGRDARQATKGLPRVVVDVCIDGIDDTLKKARDPMTASLPEKDRWSQVLKERGARLFRAKRFRRAEAVWHDGVKMFSFWKPEDSGLDPGDYHLRENARSRTLSIPLMLNEAMLMRKRRAFKDAELSLNECIENDGNHVKALFRRGQVRVDLQKWELAKDDLRRAIDLGGAAVEADVARELARLKKMERAQDAKDGKGADARAVLYPFKDAWFVGRVVFLRSVETARSRPRSRLLEITRLLEKSHVAAAAAARLLENSHVATTPRPVLLSATRSSDRPVAATSPREHPRRCAHVAAAAPPRFIGAISATTRSSDRPVETFPATSRRAGMKHTFDDDRDAIYGEKVSNEKRVARAKAEVKAAAAKRDAGLFSVDAGVREDVKKTSSQKPSDYDWTSSYHTGDRPAYETAAAADPNPSNRPVLVDDLDAELEEISDEEEEAKRAAKQEYYNTQIGLGNMRVQLPPPGQGSAGEGGE